MFCFIRRTSGDEWPNVAFRTGGRWRERGGVLAAKDYDYRLSGFLKMNLDPVDFPFPSNWCASHFEILLFESCQIGAFWRFFPALRRNNTWFQILSPPRDANGLIIAVHPILYQLSRFCIFFFFSLANQYCV